MGGCFSTGNAPRSISVSDLNPEGVQQKQDDQKASESEGESQDAHRTPRSETHADKSEEVVISSIRATDLALGLERIPAGFYIAVVHSGLEWRTENKAALVDNDVEWSGPIPIPSDPSANVTLVVRASFEFQPMMGNGEQLRELKVTVEQLLDHSARNLEFTFPQNERDSSPCSSLLVAVRRWGNDSIRLGVLAPYRPATDLQAQLEDMTDEGHNALSRYRKHGAEWDLELAMEHFRDALGICPLDHPCIVVAQSNLAMARVFHCRVRNRVALFEIPLTLYRNALVARPVGHPDRARTLVQLAAAHLMRFAKQRDGIDVADAEALLREAVDLSPVQSHEHQAAVSILQMRNGHRMETVQAGDQSSPSQDPTSGVTDVLHLSTLLLGYFEQFGDLATLEQAISILDVSIRSNSSKEQQHLAELAMSGVLLRHRYDYLGELPNLEEAISRQREAIRLASDGHPHKSMFLNSLGNSLMTRFERLGEPSDLEEAISNQRDAVHLTPNDRPDKPALLNNLSISLITRFEHVSREPGDFEEAISRKRDAVDLTPDGDSEKPVFLNSLGNSLLTRFERLGQPSDLEEAILRHQDALHLTPNGRSEKPGFLNDLAICLVARFERVAGDLSNLEDAISRQQDAVDLTPDGDPEKAAFLNSLCNSLRTRFERLGELDDLKEAISRQQDAVYLTPDGNPHKPRFLSNLSNSFIARFERLGELDDLEEAISMQRDAIELTPEDHPDKIGCLNNLGIFLRARFERLGEPGDLEEAISQQEDAVELIPDGHPDKPGLLNNLGLSLISHFEHIGQPSDLEEAIARQRDAVHLTPDGHPHKPVFLSNLSNSFITRFERLGEVSDLEEAISRLRNAVYITPEGHSDKPRRLHNLGAALMSHFKRLGELNDLEEAISKQQDAVDLTPDGHSHKPEFLNNLGNSFRTRFERLGELSNLEGAIARQRNAVNLTPDGHPDKPVYLDNLGISLFSRLNRLGELSDLEEGISKQRDAVNLTPDGRPDKPILLNNLSNSLLTCFERLGQLSDLEEAISREWDAVHLTPDGHPQKPRYFNNLGNLLRTRFEHLGELSDLEEAISRQWDAVHLTPDGHPNMPVQMNNLGISLRNRFDCIGELKDVEEAIARQLDAVDLTPGGHSYRPFLLYHLGESFLTRFRRLRQLSDLQQAALSYSNAACDYAGPIAVRFHASRQWIFCSRLLGHQTPLHACSVAIHLLPQLAWIGLPLSHRYRELIEAADVVREAAAVALDSGRPETAVEWLEQGRSIVWGGMSELRSSHDELSCAFPDYALRLRELSAALEHASSAREKFVFSPLEQASSAEHRTLESLQQMTDNHRTLAIERDKLLEDIRKLPGFERFLLHKEFSQLRSAAHAGPVIILNVAETRCDALIILADVDHVVHVPLSNFTLQRSIDLRTSLGSFVRHASVIPDDRDGRPVPQENRSRLEPTLASLWKFVVKPVLDALALSVPGELPRIFWCPTGPLTFLPIHAAGFYDPHHSRPGHKVYDFVVSSYVPSLSILLSPFEPSPSWQTNNLRLLAVRQPPSDGQSRLPGVIPELEHIRTAIRNVSSGDITLVESSVGTVEEVLSLMKDADWVHFACHGVQDANDPTASGLCLADKRRLKLSDVISLSRPRGGLAFLSACQTAKGDEDLSDEAIHIAAGMLYAGYGGLIGTMWSISDKYAPAVAKNVYEQLLLNSKRPDYREAARALHVAVGRLRDNIYVPFDDWLPFIHVGL